MASVLVLLALVAGASPGIVPAAQATAAAEHPVGHITIHGWAFGSYLLHTPPFWSCSTPAVGGGMVPTTTPPMLLYKTEVYCNPPPPAPGNVNECILVDTYGYGVPAGTMTITANCDGASGLTTSATFPLGGPAGWSAANGSDEFPFGCIVDVLTNTTTYDWWAHCEVNGVA